MLTLQSNAGAVHNGAAVLFNMSLGRVNSAIYFQMLGRHPDLVLLGSMQSCGFKMQCPEPDSITSWLNSSREMKKPLDAHQELPAKKITYGFN